MALQVSGDALGNSEREISDHVVKLFDAAIARRTKSEMDGYGEGTKIHRLGLAMGLVALYEAKDLGKLHDRTLAQADEDAFNVIGLRKAALDEMLLGLAQDAEVQQFFARVRDHAVLEVLGRGGRTEIVKFANYLRGENFWNKLKGLNPAQRSKTAKNEMRKLVALDASLGQEVATVLLARQVEEEPLPVLQEQSVGERTRAWNQLLLFLAAIAEREGHSEGSAAANGIAGAKKGAKFVGVSKKVTAVLRDSGRRARIAGVLGRRVPHRAFYSALAADDVTPLMAGMELGADEKEALGAALGWAKRYGWVGSTVTTLTSLLAIAGMVANWPPTDGNGNVDWSELATFTASGLSTVGSLPTVVTFVKTDLAEFAAKAFGKELAKPAATAATEAATKVGWATRFCKIAGPVGDAIFIGINFHAMLEERKNGDTVGEAARLGQVVGGGIGLIGGLMVLSGGAAATGVGVPLALVGAAVSLVAAVIDWGWGQSDLADASYRNLSALGLINAEERAFKRLATDSRTVWRGNRGGAYQTTERYRVGHTEVKKRFAAASQNDRVGMINQFLDESTSGSEESLVHAVLKQTPYENEEFLVLIEKIDGRRLVDELETDWQAGDVLLWTARAYHRAGKQETPELWVQLTELCRQHRPGAVLHFLKKIEKPIYQKLDAEKLRDATVGLCAPPIRNDDREALLQTLDKMSWAQFDTAMMTGGLPYVHRVRFCLLLGGQRWQKVQGMMRDDRVSDELAQWADYHEAATSMYNGGSETMTVTDTGYTTTITLPKRRSPAGVAAQARSRFEKLVVVSGAARNARGSNPTTLNLVLRNSSSEDLLYLLEQTDPKKVALALSEEDAGAILLKTLHAYRDRGEPAGRLFYDQLDAHCRYQRAIAVNTFVQACERPLYKQLDPARLSQAGAMFDFDGNTANEGVVLYNLLSRTSYSQFNKMIELGHLTFVRLLKRAVRTDLWRKIHDWMTAKDASARVKHLSLQVAR